MKENIKAPRHWPLCGEVTGTGEFPAQRPVTRKMFSFDDVIMVTANTSVEDFFKIYRGFLRYIALTICRVLL